MLPTPPLWPDDWRRSLDAPGGYLWWYFDALAPSGDALVCILFVGSVFSPAYAARLRRGEPALPREHCAVNLALYRGGQQLAWVMSEYPRAAALDEDRVAIGGTELLRDERGWRVRFDERRTPFFGHRRGGPIAGEIRVEALEPPAEPAVLERGRHAHGWRAVAPRTRALARFPALDFALDGTGYHDVNHGDGRLEDAFARWGWARFHRPSQTEVLYVFVGRDGRREGLHLESRGGAPAALRSADPLADGPIRRLPWGIDLPSSFGVDDGAGAPRRCFPGTTIERAPFYTRFHARLDGAPGRPAGAGLGEWLDLDQFRRRWNQFLLGFKTVRWP